MRVVMVEITAPSRAEAERIGRALVEERLASCANLLGGMRSIYRWKGRVEEAEATPHPDAEANATGRSSASSAPGAGRSPRS